MGPLTKTQKAAQKLAAATHILSELLDQDDQSFLYLALERYNGGPINSPEILLTMSKDDINSLTVDDVFQDRRNPCSHAFWGSTTIDA